MGLDVRSSRSHLIPISSNLTVFPTVSVEFFDDMYIPLTYLPEPSALYVQPLTLFFILSLSTSFLRTNTFTSDPNERAHFWLPTAADSETKPTVHDMLDSQTTERMYIDAGEIVRVRVEADEFYDHEPGPPPKALEGVRVAREQKKAPYTIIVRNWMDLSPPFVS